MLELATTMRRKVFNCDDLQSRFTQLHAIRIGATFRRFDKNRQGIGVNNWLV